MPPVGGFVALCAQGGRAPEAHKRTVRGDFFKIEFMPSINAFKGKLIIMFSSYRICHEGVKVCLEGNLSLSRCVDILEHYPTETILLSGGELLRQKRLNFNLPLQPHQSYPSPFMTSNGSLEYRIVAFIKRDGSWEPFAHKLVNFKGYYNVLHMGVSPYVDTKVIQTNTGEIVSTFTVPNTVAVMGQCDCVEGILELQGVLESQVNATLTFYRIIVYGKLKHSEIILTQNRIAEVHQKNVTFNWSVVVPTMKRISYSDESIPMYSVRYYLKYEVFMGLGSGAEEHHAVINGIVEVEIGTTRDAYGLSSFDSQSEVTTNQTIGIPQTGRRKSVASLMSMLSLPPAYSQLSSRSGSMMSLETLPPLYDELKKQ